MFSSQWLQPHPAVLVLPHTLGNVLRILPFYLGKRLITDGLYFDVIVFFLEQSVNEIWKESCLPILSKHWVFLRGRACSKS
jgi:hypothetical protein